MARTSQRYDKQRYEAEYAAPWLEQCKTITGLADTINKQRMRYGTRLFTWLDGMELNGRLLEMGFNDGKSLVWLSEKYPYLEMDALDFNETLRCIEQPLRELVPSLKDVMYCDCTNVDKPDATYDVITCLDLFEHLPYYTYMNTLLECRRLLKDDGCLLVFVGQGEQPGHINLMTLKELLADAKANGFKVVEHREADRETLTVFAKNGEDKRATS